MTEKDVLIFVRGEQHYEDAEPDVTELMTEGTMTISDDGCMELTYRETELTGMEGTTTTFAIRGHCHADPHRFRQLPDCFSEGEAAQLLLRDALGGSFRGRDHLLSGPAAGGAGRRDGNWVFYCGGAPGYGPLPL